MAWTFEVLQKSKESKHLGVRKQVKIKNAIFCIFCILKEDNIFFYYFAEHYFQKKKKTLNVEF